MPKDRRTNGNEGPTGRNADSFLGIDVLEPLSREEVDYLRAELPVTGVAADEVFYTPSHHGDALFLLLEGKARVYTVVAGRELAFMLLESGTLFGEMTQPPPDAPEIYAQAVEPSRVVLMSQDRLRGIIREEPEVGIKLIEKLSERSSVYRTLVTDILLKDVPARLATLLCRLVESEGVVTRRGHKVFVRYTHEQLGSMIGAKRVAVTRAFAKLRSCGVLEIERHMVYVRDMEELKRVAGKTRS